MRARPSREVVIFAEGLEWVGVKRYELQYPNKNVNFNSIFARERWGRRPRKGCGPESIINRVGLLRAHMVERYRHKLASYRVFASVMPANLLAVRNIAHGVRCSSLSFSSWSSSRRCPESPSAPTGYFAEDTVK